MAPEYLRGVLQRYPLAQVVATRIVPSRDKQPAQASVFPFGLMTTFTAAGQLVPEGRLVASAMSAGWRSAR